MKKLLMLLFCYFFFLFLAQGLLEGIFYCIFVVVSDIANSEPTLSFIVVLEFIVVYSVFRFVCMVIPYLILSLLFSKLIVKRPILYIGILNLISNAALVGFFVFYIEPIGKKFFFNTLFVGAIILILGIVLQRSNVSHAFEYLFKKQRREKIVMKKLLIFSLLFFFLFLLQCLLEGGFYFILAIFLGIANSGGLKESFIEALELIAGYLGYRFEYTVIPYLILSLLFSNLIVKRPILYIGILNLIVNAVIVLFLLACLARLLAPRIFLITLFAGAIILILGVVLQRSRRPFIEARLALTHYNAVVRFLRRFLFID